MAREVERRRRILAKLPPLQDVLRGSVIVRVLRCGKPGCRCAQGEGHRATYLSVTHAGGHTEQISLPAALVPQALRGVAAYRAWWGAVEKLSAINRDRLRQQRRAQAALRRRPTGRSSRPRRPR
jgi:hypothetical protein